MQPASRSTATNVLSVVVGLLLAMALAPAGSAAAATLAMDRANPVVGESITFTGGGNECNRTYTFTVDDNPPEPTQPIDDPTFTTSFADAGSHTVKVDIDYTSGACQDYTETATFEVLQGLGGSIAVSPDPPRPGQTATLSASQTGGYGPPFHYAWDLDDDGSFDDSTSRTPTTAFPTTAPRVFRVRIRDSATPVHETVVTRTISAADPPTPEPGVEPPVEPPCVKRLAFALSELTTPGCFEQIGAIPSARWTTTSTVKLNGITFPDFGQTFTITFPTASEPGGHFTAPSSAIQLGGFTAYSGNVDWTLPAGGQGDEKLVSSFTVPRFAELFRLRVRGATAVRLGWGADGEHYATFALNVELPAVFKPAPDPYAESVTGSGSLRVDDAGPRFDGLKIFAKDVWLGRIRVPEACFSYVPAGGQVVAPCDAPSLDGEPYITCNDDTNTDRWDVNGILELPGAGVRYAVFGGLADGRLTRLGGFADNIAIIGVQLAPGVLLNRLGAGVCLSPPPLKVRGDVGVEALDGRLRVDGRFTYTDPDGIRPWSVEAGGSASFRGMSLGNGSLKYNAWGDIDFGVRTDLNLFDVASFAGEANGWVEPQKDLFNISGSGTGCIATVICANTSALVSSSGVAGCIDAGEIVLYEPVNARTGPFGFGSISFSVREHRFPIKAGFGHRFGASGVDLLGNSCDFAPYSATRSVARAAQAGTTAQIAPGSKAVSLRIHGSDGPPKVVVRGPGATTITSPATASGKRLKGRYLLAENTTDGTTSVLLIRPRAGTWTVKAAPAATSTPTRVDRSNYAEPATFAGRVRRRSAGRLDLVMAYAAPAGTKVRLVERGKGIARTIVATVRGRACKGRQTLPGGRRLRCARATFRPSRGPGGARRVQALVTRGGLPVAREDVASFRAPRERLPSRPGALRARRVRGDLVVVFPRSRGASRYSVTATVDDGRKLGFDLGRTCRAVRIPAVPSGVGASVKVAGVRYDLRTGRYRSIRLAKTRTSAGRAGLLPRRICS